MLFSEEEILAITEAAVRFFQARGDGEPGDWFVSFPYIDENTVEDFLGFLQEQHPGFSKEQIDALQAALPNLVIETKTKQSTEAGWREHPRYFTMRESFLSHYYIPFEE